MDRLEKSSVPRRPLARLLQYDVPIVIRIAREENPCPSN
jgi:hypothetical protein